MGIVSRCGTGLFALCAPGARLIPHRLCGVAVHGMAFLVLSDPLRVRGEPELQALAERLVVMVERGLLADLGG